MAKSYSFSEIARILGVPMWKINRIAKKEGVKSYYTLQREKTANDIKDLHLKGHNYIEIAKKLGISRSCTRDWYTKNNIKIDGPGSGAIQCRKVTNNPFTEVADPEVQYWLGMLAADGNLAGSSYSITLSQSVERAGVLEEYVKFLNGDTLKIHVSKGTGNIKDKHIVTFGNKEIYTYLISLGFTSKKAKTLNLNFKITWDFIRGYFDGDGSAKYYPKTHSYKIKITSSSTYMIDCITEFFKKEGVDYSVTLKSKKYPDQQDINILTKGRRNLFNKMYKDNLFCVSAKRGIIEQSINENSVN